MSKHRRFILSPVSEILKDVASANAGIGNGIETYPLSEYVLQAVFLKMTGFQEQKMKCICWDLATEDYDYRYKRYSQSPLGECSSYKEKNIVYQDLIESIQKYNPDFDVSKEVDKTQHRTSTINEIKEIFSSSNLLNWVQLSFKDFIEDTSIFPLTQFVVVTKHGTILFENLLQNEYTLLYNHRNRSAHNTQSYQENLPTLKSLLKESAKNDNYIVRFALLILIDKIFISLYEKYMFYFDEYQLPA